MLPDPRHRTTECEGERPAKVENKDECPLQFTCRLVLSHRPQSTEKQSSGRVPCQRRGHHRFDPGFERRVQHRSEVRAVIDRQLVYSVSLFCFGIENGIGATDEPEDRRGIPTRSKASEILARRCRAGMPDAVRRKMGPEGCGDLVACCLVVTLSG